MRLSTLIIATLVFLCGIPIKASENIFLDENLIEERLNQLDISVDAEYSNKVKSYLRNYFVHERSKAQSIVTNAEYYFPVYDYYLSQEGLPADLKYLSVLESALKNTAVSRAGAVGLWQFMKPTARELGLSIDAYVDERRDPEKSTEAAVKYLSKLYNKFGNWSFAIIAYNCGPTRLNRAIKKAGSRDLKTVLKHLPKETQNYIPAFVAASYLMNYYYLHDIQPFSSSPLIAAPARITKVYDGISFQEVAIRSGADVGEISALNPQYFKKIVPPAADGYNIKIPEEHFGIFKASLSIPDRLRSEIISGSEILAPDEYEYFEKVSEKIYRVRSGDNLYDIAKKHDCSIKDLKSWNNLSSDRLKIGQKLTLVEIERLYVNRVVLPDMKFLQNNLKAIFPSKTKTANRFKQVQLFKLNNVEGTEKLYNRYIIQRGESLSEIAETLNISLEGLLALNKLDKYNLPKPGMCLLIPITDD